MCRDNALISALESLIHPHKQTKDDHSIGELTDQLQHDAYSFSAILITLPFLQPFPIGFFALIGTAAYWSIAWQLWTNSDTLVLPTKARKFRLTQTTINKLAKTCLFIIKPIHAISKPRLAWLCQAPLIRIVGSILFFVVGLLVAIPLGGVIPFRNTLPALAIVLYTMAESEEDGLLLIFAMICVLLTIVLYIWLILFVWQLGSAALTHTFS